jgi:signal transduction histidine kinase
MQYSPAMQSKQPRDITDREKSREALLQSQKELRRLTARLLDKEKNSSKQLAAELHDALGQKLAVLGMEVAALSQSLPQNPGALAGRLRGLASQIGSLANDAHDLSRRLHPAILDDLGLDAALREECQAFSQRSGIPTRYTPERIPTSLPESVSLCLYRVVQESLRNIAKHAKASAVRVRLSGGKRGIRLKIEDQGDGFHLSEIRNKGGLGLVSMEERVRLVSGDFTIQSQPGKGTQVNVFVPLSGVKPGRAR